MTCTVQYTTTELVTVERTPTTVNDLFQLIIEVYDLRRIWLDVVWNSLKMTLKNDKLGKCVYVCACEREIVHANKPVPQLVQVICTDWRQRERSLILKDLTDLSSKIRCSHVWRAVVFHINTDLSKSLCHGIVGETRYQCILDLQVLPCPTLTSFVLNHLVQQQDKPTALVPRLQGNAWHTFCHFLTIAAVFHAFNVQSAWRVTTWHHMSHGQPLSLREETPCMAHFSGRKRAQI